MIILTLAHRALFQLQEQDLLLIVSWNTFYISNTYGKRAKPIPKQYVTAKIQHSPVLVSVNMNCIQICAISISFPSIIFFKVSVLLKAEHRLFSKVPSQNTVLLYYNPLLVDSGSTVRSLLVHSMYKYVLYSTVHCIVHTNVFFTFFTFFKK